MGYTEKQAEAKARQIFTRFGGLIHLACSNSIVPEDFLAGFIGVEAGIDRTGQIRPEATRFEPGVYHKLTAVRDGLMSRWSGIVTRDLNGLSDAAIRNLATSWGMTQIMGWHLIHNLKGTIQDLRDPDKHLHFTVQLLVLTASVHLKSGRFDNVLRIWNTGSANGKTYHDDYVDNALLVKRHYAAILQANRNAFSSAAEPQTLAQPELVASQNAAIESAAEPASQPAQPPTFVADEKTVDAPPPTGFMAKLKVQGAAILASIGGAAGIKEWLGIQLGPETVGLLKILLPTVLTLGFVGFLVWFISEKVVGFKTLKLQSEIATDPTRHDLVINKQ